MDNLTTKKLYESLGVKKDCFHQWVKRGYIKPSIRRLGRRGCLWRSAEIKKAQDFKLLLDLGMTRRGAKRHNEMGKIIDFTKAKKVEVKCPGCQGRAFRLELRHTDCLRMDIRMFCIYCKHEEDWVDLLELEDYIRRFIPDG